MSRRAAAHDVPPRTGARRPRRTAEYEFERLTIPRDFSRSFVTRMLVERAEHGGWEIDRLRVLHDGTRKVVLRRRIIRQPRLGEPEPRWARPGTVEAGGRAGTGHVVERGADLRRAARTPRRVSEPRSWAAVRAPTIADGDAGPVAHPGQRDLQRRPLQAVRGAGDRLDDPGAALASR